MTDDTQPDNFSRASVFSLSVFAHPEEWLFARGCPPPLRDPRPWVRGTRATVLLGVLGGLVGSASIIPMIWAFNDVSMVAFLGAMYGLLVLMPIARWTGWRWTACGFVVWGALLHLPLAGMHPMHGDMVGTIVLSGGMVLTTWFVYRFPSKIDITLPIVCAVMTVGVATGGPGMLYEFGRDLSFVSPALLRLWKGAMTLALVEALLAIGLSGPYWHWTSPSNSNDELRLDT